LTLLPPYPILQEILKNRIGVATGDRTCRASGEGKKGGTYYRRPSLIMEILLAWISSLSSQPIQTRVHRPFLTRGKVMLYRVGHSMYLSYHVHKSQFHLHIINNVYKS